MSIPEYKSGMKVNILKGKYKRFGSGIYLRPYGEKMACIKVDGDTQQERNLRLTSIAPSEINDDTVTIERAEYEALLRDMADLKLTVTKLSKRLNECGAKP